MDGKFKVMQAIEHLQHQTIWPLQRNHKKHHKHQ